MLLNSSSGVVGSAMKNLSSNSGEIYSISPEKNGLTEIDFQSLP